MAQHTEPLGGGLVTSRDPSILGEGELQQADDCIYKPNDPALYSAPGRQKLNADAIAAITGLRYCAFDAPDPDRLVAQTSTSYQVAPIETGDFATVATILGGPTFDSIHYRNKHVLINGVNENKVLLSDATVRQHGMKPVTGTPSIEVKTTGGDWPLGADSVPNYYEYWTTEVLIREDDEGNIIEEIEGTFEGTPASVFIQNVDYYVIATRPDPRQNPEATHWRLYRSTSKEDINIRRFPNGVLIGELPIDDGPIKDGLAVSLGPKYPTAAAFTSIPGGPGGPLYGYSQEAFTNYPGFLADDASNATGQTQRSGTLNARVAILSGFDFSTAGSPITNIKVELEGSNTRVDGQFGVQLSWNAGVSTTEYHTYTIGPTPGIAVFEQGKWGREWTASELSTSNFRVYVWAVNLNVNGAVDHTCDFVRITVEHGGTTSSQAIPFPSVIITTGPAILPVGRHGPPPIAFTGDIFEESLVLNDVSQPNLISYSTQENIDSFPSPYTLSFQTKDKDTIRCIRALGNVLIVGLYSKVFRVNYLPRELDAEFDRGRAVDLISSDHGIIGPRAACVFQMDSQPVQLAYVSRYGLHLTDGYRVTTLTNDIDWTEVNLTDTCEIVNDPQNYQLVLFLADRKYHFSYHPVHLKDGKLKVSGPVLYAATGATSASLQTGSTGFYTARSDGFVYVENSGTEDESGGEIEPTIRTRDIYLAGLGNEWKLEKVLLHHEAQMGVEITGGLRVEKTNAVSRDTQDKRIPALARGLSRLPLNDAGEGISIKLEADGQTKFNYLVLEGEGFGTEDSLR